MTRAYIRLDPLLVERKATYPDGPYRAFIDCLCLAETQPERGRFRSVKYLRALLDKAGRHVAYLLEHGDLTELSDGRVYLDGWDEWQEGDLTVRDRVARTRNRRRNGQGNGDVTVDVTVPNVTHRLDSADSTKQSAAKTDDRYDIFDLYYRLTTRTPSKTVMDWLDRLVDEFTIEVIRPLLVTLWSSDPNVKDFLGRVEMAAVTEMKRRAAEADERRHASELEYQRQERERIANASPEEKARAAVVKADIKSFLETVR